VNDGTNTWERNFLDYTNVHSTTLLGFKPGRTNAITVTVHDKYRNEVTASHPVNFITAPLPSNFPNIVLLSSKPDKMEPGYTLFRGLNNGSQAYVIIVDSAGEVVFWYPSIASVLDVRQLANGDLFMPLVTTMTEVNMLGQTVQTWVVPTAWRINNHDGVPTDHGTILYLSDASRVVTNFPTSATISNAPTATTNVQYQTVIEISYTNAALLNVWHTIDLLDPRRISYLTFSAKTAMGWDWGHANAVIEDPRDDSLIVSLRHQNAVIKFSRATGQLKWILGPHENWAPAFQQYLLTPVGAPFAWNYAQHAPEITPQGTLLLYDDGDYRASPFDAWVPDANNYSRAVEYSINEATMEVSQVWEYASTNETLYTWSVGDADWLKTRGNVLVTFGNISYVNGAHPSPYSTNAAMARIKEVTHDPDPEVVFDLALFDYANTNKTYSGCFTYRSDRIPDLYSVLPQAVADLTVTFSDGQPHLEFSGSETRTYVVEASTNLVDWDQIGVAEPSGSGNYDFQDEQSDDFPARFYRIVTQ
jgi:arylsulfate sulfotransferase